MGLAAADLVTHGYVVAESLAVARRRFGVEGAIALIDDLLPAIDVLTVESAVHAAAMARYRTAFVFDAEFAGVEIQVIP